MLPLPLPITLARHAIAPISLNGSLALLESAVPKCDGEPTWRLKRRFSALFHQRRLRWHPVRIVGQVVHRMNQVTSRVNDPWRDKNDQVFFLRFVGLAAEQSA